MAIMNINIVNPTIDLISNIKETSNNCKSVFVFSIKSTPGANITIDIQRINGFLSDYNTLYLNNGSGFIIQTSESISFVLNSKGLANFKIEIENAGNVFQEAYDPQGNQYITNELAQACGGVVVTVTDATNNLSTSSPFSRCSSEERCIDYTNPIPPPPTTPKIDSNTNIRIYFDASGSMNSTLDPLNDAKNGPLRQRLLSYYNGNVNTYNSKVKIVQMASVGSLLYENPFSTLNYGGENLSGKVISLVFMDEADTFAVPGQTPTDPSNPDHNTHLPVLRQRLAQHPANYYKGVIFVVHTPDVGGDMIAFRTYINAVKNGTGVYAGTNGLSDKPEVKVVNNVTPADTPENYSNLIINTLNEFGFNIP